MEAMIRWFFTPFAFFLFLFSGVLASSAALAQDRLPSINQMNEQDKITLPLPPRNQNFSMNNPYLEDLLQLQYQIGLLERMIQRQGNIARLEKSYLELGLPFAQPLPPKGICEQLPANVPCHRAYPEMYDIILPEIVPLDSLIEEPLSVDMLAEDDPALVPEKPKDEISIERQATFYRWVEVLCGGGVCSAVILKEGDRNSRRTVLVGDTLEKGKIEVSEISSAGVIVKEAGQDVKLSAALAPSQGGPSSPIFAKGQGGTASVQPVSPLGDILKEKLQDPGVPGIPSSAPAASGSAPISVPPAVPAPRLPEISPNTPIQDPGPPLGPTGLF